MDSFSIDHVAEAASGGTVATCNKCSQTSAEGIQLSRCGKCLGAYYCGKSRDIQDICQHCFIQSSYSRRVCTGQQCQHADWAQHKTVCRRPDYIVSIEIHAEAESILTGMDGNHEKITIKRVLRCPATATFKHLHQAIQIAFGFSDFRLHAFHVMDPAHFEPSAEATNWNSISENVNHLLHITEQGQQDNYFREQEFVPGANPSTGCEQSRFEKAGRAMPPIQHTHSTKLYTIFGNAKFAPARLVYTYNFKNPIFHVLTLQRSTPTASGLGQIPQQSHDTFRVLSGVGPDLLGLEPMRRRLPSPAYLFDIIPRTAQSNLDTALHSKKCASLTPDFNDPGSHGINVRLAQMGLVNWKVPRGEGRDWFQEAMADQIRYGA